RISAAGDGGAGDLLAVGGDAVARVRDDGVVAGAAAHEIARSIGGEDGVVAAATAQHVGRRAAVQAVVAGIAAQQVAARPAVEAVRAGIAGEAIGAPGAADGVAAAARRQLGGRLGVGGPLLGQGAGLGPGLDAVGAEAVGHERVARREAVRRHRRAAGAHVVAGDLATARQVEVVLRAQVGGERVRIAGWIHVPRARVIAPAVAEEPRGGLPLARRVADALDVAVEPRGRVPGGDVLAAEAGGAERVGQRVARDQRVLVVGAAAQVHLHRVDAGR